MIDKLSTLFPSVLKKSEKKPTDLPKNTHEDQRERFFANLSHEIRTPINGIVGFTQLLKETGLNSEQDELVNTIHSSSMHLLSLVNDILDFSKINSGKMELEQISFDLFRQLEDTVEVYAPLAQKKDIELGVFIDPAITPILVGDPTKLSQIIANLVSNAIKFTDAFGEVNLVVTKSYEDPKHVTLEFSVKDTGIGIEEGDQEKVFDAFVQANSSIGREYGGTGLGLAISKKMVELMGGELKLFSSYGIGTEFTFELKFEKSRSKDRKIYQDLYMGVRAAFILPNKESTRVVDLNLKRYLEYLGAEVEIYYNNEIFSFEQSRYPDLLFVDVKYCNLDIGKLTELGIKIVTISTLQTGKSQNVNSESVCKNIYKPVNFTKVARSFEVCLDSFIDEDNKSDEPIRDFSGLRALIVDDNEINQMLLMKLLLDMHMDVERASDGMEAVEFYKNIEFDIILMDIEMPLMDGIEATKEILNYEKEKGMVHTPILALSGNVEDKDIERYKEIGMDGFVPKPIDLDILISNLNRFTLDRRLFGDVSSKKSVLDGAKALIVEENEIEQKLVERALASKGVEFVSVNTPTGILDLRKDDEFDIIFINASTPVMNGAETIKVIREFESTSMLERVPIIAMLSSGSEDKHFDIYREMGADSYLVKPVDVEDVKFLLDRYIDPDNIGSKAIDTEENQIDGSSTEDIAAAISATNDLSDVSDTQNSSMDEMPVVKSDEQIDTEQDGAKDSIFESGQDGSYPALSDAKESVPADTPKEISSDLTDGTHADAVESELSSSIEDVRFDSEEEVDSEERAELIEELKEDIEEGAESIDESLTENMTTDESVAKETAFDTDELPDKTIEEIEPQGPSLEAEKESLKPENEMDTKETKDDTFTVEDHISRVLLDLDRADSRELQDIKDATPEPDKQMAEDASGHNKSFVDEETESSAIDNEPTDIHIEEQDFSGTDKELQADEYQKIDRETIRYTEDTPEQISSKEDDREHVDDKLSVVAIEDKITEESEDDISQKQEKAEDIDKKTPKKQQFEIKYIDIPLSN